MSIQRKSWALRIGPTAGASILGVVLAVVTLQCQPPEMPAGPKSKPAAAEPAGPQPSILFSGRKLHQPPPLAGSGDDARRATLTFIEWAGASTVSEREDGRKVMASARDNQDVVATLADEIMKAKDTDHSRALLCLSILGELRSPMAQTFLRDFVSLPLPDPSMGPMAEGEPVLVTALAALQAKAVDGLAYYGDLQAGRVDEFLLSTIGRHPSRIVRAAAINAYLWNAQEPMSARALVQRSIMKGEEIFIDRIRLEDDEKAATFNAKLAVFLNMHPEVMPPAPEKAMARDAKDQPIEDVLPDRPIW